MEFRILGPVELWADGKQHELGARKERCLLAALLSEPGQPVPAESLIERVWGGDPPDNAAKSLHENVSRLRKRLQTAGESGRMLAQRSGSYLIEASRADVDAWRFRALRDQARAAANTGDLELAIDQYTEADALWHGGIPLDGLDGNWVEGVRARLTEERSAAVKQRIRAGLHLGRHADLVGEIADLMRQGEPDEALVDLHLRALYGAGRRAEALDAYRRAERRWSQAWGVDLGPALRELHLLMLRDDPALSAVPPPNQPARLAAAQPPPAPSSTLPRDDPDFTGRTAELDALDAWLSADAAQSSVPIVVITGMAGVGKSSLAVHVAHQLRARYPDQLHLSLHAHDPDEPPVPPAAALGSLLRRLGVPDKVIPADREERAGLLRFKLDGRKALIFLDDAHDAAQVLPLLPGAPGCLVLVTTRYRTLTLPGMLPLPLGPLPHQDAVSLFARKAGTDADPAAVSRVVSLCGHLPQRISLAGRQLRGHPAWRVSDLVTRLLAAGSGEREMTAAFELSYRCLMPDQQRLFRLLALHPRGSFSLHAALALAGDASPGVTWQALDGLLDTHLLEEPIPGYYTFHDLIREYAESLASATSAGDRRQSLRRLLDYYVCLIHAVDQVVHPFGRRMPLPEAMAAETVLPLTGTRAECLARLETEKASLLMIARYAASDNWLAHAGLLAHLLGGFLDTWGDWTEAIGLHHSAVSAWRAAADVTGEVTALSDLAFMLSRTGRQTEAADYAREAVTAAQPVTGSTCAAAALDTLGVVLSHSASYAEALACHDQALSLWRDIGDRHGEADALSRSGMPAARLGRHDDAVRRLERALAIFSELGDIQGSSNALNNIGGLQQDAGCYDEALSSYEQAKTAFLEIGDRQGEAIALSNVGDIWLLSGNHQAATDNYRAALDIFRDIGDRGSEAEALNGLAAAFARAGEGEAAASCYEKALALGLELGERHTQAASYLGLGAAHLDLARYQAAADDYRAALLLSGRIADPVQAGQAHHGLGRALLRTEGGEAARTHWQAALSLLSAASHPEADEVRARLSLPQKENGEGSGEPRSRSDDR